MQYSEYRIAPAFLTSKLTQIGSSVINPAKFGLESVSKGMILDVHEIMESNIDESLILMNEAGLEEKDLRKVFIFLKEK